MRTFESDDDRLDDRDDDDRGERRGLFATAKGLVHRLVTLLHTRAELFSTELEEEVARLIGVLIWSFVGVLCAVIGLTFIAVTVLLAVPEHYRPWVAGGLALVFLAIAAFGARSIRKIVAAKVRPFDASLRELEKDREQLEAKR
jgi:uncharacterized membrane protein YqjE